jgi:hypothetical protein
LYCCIDFLFMEGCAMLVTGDSALTTFYKYSGSSSPIKTDSNVLTLSSKIDSFGHDIRDIGRFPTGGPFFLYKYTAAFDSVEVPMVYTAGAYRGGLFTLVPTDNLKVHANVTVTSTLAALQSASYSLGASAIAHSSPTRPEVEMLTAVGEVVHDGLPSMAGSSLWREQTQRAKSAGSEYLNAEFGWLPLVSDIRKFAKTVADSFSIIREYERGSGQRTRRGFGFPAKTTSAIATTPARNAYPTETVVWDETPQILVTSTSDRIWFNGAFRYYLAPSGLKRYQQLASKLYGVQLTPDVLWNLAPWTWAADWFGNFGDVLTNVSNLGPDACVMEWGYMMHEQDETRVASSILKGVSAGSSHPYTKGRSWPLNVTTSNNYKTRIGASPYGFSVTPAVLTVRQSAILVALGLSHLAR